MPLPEEQIESLSLTALTSALSVPLAVADAPYHNSDSDFQWSRVQVEGGWCGELFLGCDPVLLQDGAAVFFGSEPNDVTPEDAADMAKELANIVGGNVAAVLGEACTITPPELCQAPRSNGSVASIFTCNEKRLVVQVVVTDHLVG